MNRNGCIALLLPLSLAADAHPSINLSHWKLTTPEAAGAQDRPRELPPGELRDYASEWFHESADGGLVFRAPVGGAHTTNSQYARSELREQLVPGDDRTNWTSRDHARMTATLKVDEVPPDTGQVIIGQIHGKNASPLLKLSYSAARGEVFGKIVVEPKAEGDQASEVSLKCSLKRGVALGARFTYIIEVSDETLRYSVDGGDSCSTDLKPWRGVGLYFKAGVYTAAKRGGGAGQATFYQLDVQH